MILENDDRYNYFNLVFGESDSPVTACSIESYPALVNEAKDSCNVVILWPFANLCIFFIAISACLEKSSFLVWVESFESECYMY